MKKNYKIVPPPKRVSDWKGKKVMSKYAVHNGLGSMPAGTIFTIKYTGIRKSLYSDRCQCCCFSFRFDTKATAEQFTTEFDFIEEQNKIIVTVDDLDVLTKSIHCQKIKDGMVASDAFAKLEERLENALQVLKIDSYGLNTDDLGVLTISIKSLSNYGRHEYTHDLQAIAGVLTEFFAREPQL